MHTLYNVNQAKMHFKKELHLVAMAVMVAPVAEQLTKEEAFLDFREPARVLHNKVGIRISSLRAPVCIRRLVMALLLSSYELFLSTVVLGWSLPLSLPNMQ